jgi:Uncharacterised nucleotidyltransferase
MTRENAARSAVMAAAQAAVVDRATAGVVRALRGHDVRPVLLKGPVLERWLYEHEPRPYVDVDLLVSPDDRPRAEQTLRGLGYVQEIGDADIPPFDRELHAYTWTAPRQPAVDLHRTLPGAEAPAGDAWSALTRATEPMAVEGVEVEVLAPPARAVVVALHAAHHGTSERKPIDDLERALVRLDRDGWASAARLAAEIGAAEPFAAGLRLVPAGGALAGELGLAATTSSEVELRANPPAPLAIHLEWLRQARGPRAKARLVWRLLFPPRAFMEPPPGTRRPRLALARAYLARIAKLRHLPATLRARRPGGPSRS